MSFDPARLDRLPELLEARLGHPLPGPMIGSRYEPWPRLGRHYEQIPADARQAAVLALFYRREGQWHLPLTLRPSHLPDHAGQVSLPGGGIEPGETAPDAAIREFHEELGAAGCPVQLLGMLSPIYVTGSRFRIEPWVGWTECQPDFAPNPHEVELLLEVPLAHLIDPAALESHQRHYQGQVYTAPHFTWQSQRIWGATCMILGELVTLVRDVLEEPTS